MERNLARSKDGRTIHRADCRYARVPWHWADTVELADVSAAIESGDNAEGAVLAIARKVAKEAGEDPPTSLSAVADLPAGAQASVAQAVREKVAG